MKTINNEIITKLACVSVCVGTVPENKGRDHCDRTENGRKLYRTQYHDRLEQLRRKPGNCSRCGKPNQNGFKNCDRCRSYHQKHKQEIKIKKVVVTVDKTVLASIERRVASMELALARLQIDNRNKYKQGYAAGVSASARARYLDAYPEITKQELSQINHAYQNEE